MVTTYKSSCTMLIICTRDVKPSYKKSLAQILLMWSHLTFDPPLILLLNAHAEVNRLNFNFIISFIHYFGPLFCGTNK